MLAKKENGLPRSDSGLTVACLKMMKAKAVTNRKEMKAYLEEQELYLESKESTSVEIESVEVHEKVPKEESSAKTRRAIWGLASSRRTLLTAGEKDLGQGGSRKLLTSERRVMTTGTFLHQAEKILQEEPLKDKRSGRDIRHNQNAGMKKMDLDTRRFMQHLHSIE